MSHAAGVGAPLPREIVRAMLLLRANTLALGHSGCRPLLVDRLLDFLRARHPSGRAEQGSVGASGDLAPLAHLALPLIGRGQVELDGPAVPGADRARARPASSRSTLEAKEGLALLNGTQLMTRDRGARSSPTPTGSRDRERRRGDVASRRCSGPTSRSPPRTSSPGRIPARSRSPPSCATSCATRRSSPATTRRAHKVQDPYSLRCVPQVHGAVRDALDHLRRVLDIELNCGDRQPARLPGAAASRPRTRWRPAAAG